MFRNGSIPTIKVVKLMEREEIFKKITQILKNEGASKIAILALVRE
jgi:hypothetical protein